MKARRVTDSSPTGLRAHVAQLHRDQQRRHAHIAHLRALIAARDIEIANAEAMLTDPPPRRLRLVREEPR
jgi:hypothetical protein